jgi:uncharacterized membrane protein HdeD (DUF308 family)
MIQEMVKRVKKPTPKFFRVMRNIGLTLASISGVVLAAPVMLPVGIVTVAGYLAVTGGVIGAISQMTVEGGE